MTSKQSTEKNDFTQGSILKKLALFMLPILGALVLQAAYGAVDLLVVGRFGSTSGLSAVSTGSQVLNLVTFVVTQFAMGITVLIARYLGEKRPEQIGSVMQAPKEAVELTSVYVRICGGGIFFIIAYIMSIQPDASLTKIGLAAPVSTMVGIVLNVGFYIYLGKQEKKISKK